MSAIRAKAFAKINLGLRILGTRRDGYHELETVFQTITLHDTLTFTSRRGPFEIQCSDPACPVDTTNLIWRAADAVWRASGRPGAPEGVRVGLQKRIPLQAGLGGGSSDAAVSLRALAKLWRTRPSAVRLARMASALGSDVPFFLRGGTASGRGRGHRVRAMSDWPSSWVVLVIPRFGVSTRDAYAWWDEEAGSGARAHRRIVGSAAALLNDLEPVVAVRNPEIAALVSALRGSGARHAAMSGSGSAVFGTFESRRAATAAALAVEAPSRRTIMTRTLDRRTFERLSRL